MIFHRRDFERSMAEEMRFHVEAYADDLVRSGMPRDVALRRARVEFGATQDLREACREARGIRVFDEVRQDVRYAARQLVRSPVFAAVAILSLTLGVGANTAIFGLMDAVLLRTLPLAKPNELYFLGHGSGDDVGTASNYPLLERYREAAIFASVTSYSRRTFTVATNEGLERVDGQFASGNYHATLGVDMALGRGLLEEPDRPDEREPIAVISDGYWTRRYGRRADVIGQTLSIGGRSVTIVGVTAPGFHGLTPGYRVDITLPMSIRAMDDPGFLGARDRWISLRLVGRARADRSLEQTRSAVSDLFRRYWTEPENGREPDDVRLGALLPAARGSDELRERYGTPLRLLLGMVGIVLLIACANVASLALARGAARGREIAVRLSLGAGRARLVRQMLTESAMLAIAGGALGASVAAFATRLIASSFAIGETPIVLDVATSWRVLVFTGVMSIVTTLLVGLAPALRASRVDVTPVLKESAPLERIGSWSIGRALVAAQLALSVVVVSVAALLGRSVVNLRTVDPGFTRPSALLFDLDAGDPSMTPERRHVFFTSLDERLRALPGVSAVAYLQRSPLDHSVQFRPVEVPGFTDGKRAGASANVVTPEFFRVFGIPVVRGRSLSDGDRAGAEPVAVVDETFVRAVFGSSDPIGRRVILGADRERFTIVGVVRSARVEDLREEPERTIYTALAQSQLGSEEAVGDVKRIQVAVETQGDPASLTSAVRREVSELSRDVTISYLRTMEQQFDAALLRERLMARLSGGYGALALLLSLVGLYGVTSFSVARRRREIGIEMALGASRERVLRSVLRQTFVTATVGLVLGLSAATVTTKLVEGFLFGVTPRDPWTLGGVAVVLVVTALLAGFWPARRAASIDPVKAIAS
jgi:predicted permease